MKDNSNILVRVSGVLIFLVGAALALVMLTLTIWPDIEASTFDTSNYAFRGDKNLTSLHCPVFMTKDEIATISIRVDNPTDREANPTVLARLTRGSLTFVQEIREKVVVPPGETRVVEWKVDRKFTAYDQIILGRFYQMRNYSLPSRMATCGIYVLPFSGPSGKIVLIATFAASLVLMALGLLLQLPKDRKALMRSNNESSKRQRTRLLAFAYLGAILLVGTLLALIGNWLLSAVLAVLVAISIIVVISYSLITE